MRISSLLANHAMAIAAALLAGLVLATAAVPASAQQSGGRLYQWKDANGVTHYSQTPPARGQYQARTVNNRAASPSPATTAAADAPAETPSCTRARANLKLLESDQPLRMEGGGDAVLTAEQRQAQTELAQASIRAHCTPAQ